MLLKEIQHGKNKMDLFEAKQSHARMLWLEKIHSDC